MTTQNSKISRRAAKNWAKGTRLNDRLTAWAIETFARRTNSEKMADLINAGARGRGR